MTEPDERPAGGSGRSALIVAAATAASRLLGFVREAALAAAFGASPAVDALLVAQVVPFGLFSLMGATLRVSFLPAFIERLKSGRLAATRSTNAVLGVALGVGAVLAGSCFVGAGVVVRVTAPGLPASTVPQAAALIRILAPLFIILPAGDVLMAQLHGHRRLALPALAGIPFNVVLIAAIFLAAGQGHIAIVAVALVLAALARAGLYLWGTISLGYRYRPTLDHHDPAIRGIAPLMAPAFIGTAAGELLLLINRVAAAPLPAGTIAALNYAGRLFLLPGSIYALAITTVAYPSMAGSSLSRVAEVYRQGARWICFGLLPVALFMIVLRRPIVRLTFEHGVFGDEAAAMTAALLGIYALAILPLALVDLGNRVLFALGRVRASLWIGLGLLVVDAAAALLLRQPLGELGLGVAAVAASGLALMVQFVVVVHAVPDIRPVSLVRSLMKPAMASLVVAGVLLLANNAFPASGLASALSLLAAAALGAVLYMGLTALLGVAEAEVVLKACSSRITRGSLAHAAGNL